MYMYNVQCTSICNTGGGGFKDGLGEKKIKARERHGKIRAGKNTYICCVFCKVKGRRGESVITNKVCMYDGVVIIIIIFFLFSFFSTISIHTI